jgi:hypothetical protein
MGWPRDGGALAFRCFPSLKPFQFDVRFQIETEQTKLQKKKKLQNLSHNLRACTRGEFGMQISTVTAPCAAHGPLNAHTPCPTQRASVQPRGQQIRDQHGLFAHPATEPLGRARTPSVPTALPSMSSRAPHRTEAGGKEASADPPAHRLTVVYTPPRSESYKLWSPDGPN